MPFFYLVINTPSSIWLNVYNIDVIVRVIRLFFKLNMYLLI